MTASTGVAVGGVGLMVAAGITSGQFGHLRHDLATAQLGASGHVLIELLVEVAGVALLAVMAGTSLRGGAIAILIALWITWGIIYAQQLTAGVSELNNLVGGKQ